MRSKFFHLKWKEEEAQNNHDDDAYFNFPDNPAYVIEYEKATLGFIKMLDESSFELEVVANYQCNLVKTIKPMWHIVVKMFP